MGGALQNGIFGRSYMIFTPEAKYLEGVDAIVAKLKPFMPKQELFRLALTVSHEDIKNAAPVDESLRGGVDEYFDMLRAAQAGDRGARADYIATMEAFRPSNTKLLGGFRIALLGEGARKPTALEVDRYGHLVDGMAQELLIDFAAHPEADVEWRDSRVADTAVILTAGRLGIAGAPQYE